MGVGIILLLQDIVQSLSGKQKLENIMEKQMLPELKPLRLGELLDQAIRLYRKHFLTFIGIIAVVYVPLGILQTVFVTLMNNSLTDLQAPGQFTDPFAIFTSSYMVNASLVIVLAFVQVVLVQGIATGALNRAIADSFSGKTPTVLDAYRGIGQSWLSLVGALLFLGLIGIVAFFWWVVVPCVGWFTGLGILVFLGSVINPLVPSVIVLEGQQAIGSIRRAWNLARRRFWPLLGTVLVLMLFSAIVVSGPNFLVSFAVIPLGGVVDDPQVALVITTVLQSLVGIIFTLIYYPLQMAAFTLIYFDLRVRTEGLDLAFQLANQEETPDLSKALAVSAPQTGERLVTGAELGSFAIITLGAAGLYVLLTSVLLGGVFLLGSLLNF